jgi:hypothetical protein
VEEGLEAAGVLGSAVSLRVQQTWTLKVAYLQQQQQQQQQQMKNLMQMGSFQQQRLQQQQ